MTYWQRLRRLRLTLRIRRPSGDARKKRGMSANEARKRETAQDAGPQWTFAVPPIGVRYTYIW